MEIMKKLINPVKEFKYSKPSVKEFFEQFNFLFVDEYTPNSYYNSETNQIVLVKDNNEKIVSEQELEEFYRKHKQYSFDFPFWGTYDKDCIPHFHPNEREVFIFHRNYEWDNSEYIALRHIETGLYVTSKYVNLDVDNSTIRFNSELNTYYFVENR